MGGRPLAGEQKEIEGGSDVYFGVGRHMDALVSRIERHFGPKQGSGPNLCGDDSAFVIGVFGPWGCGKTHWLKHIEAVFNEKIQVIEERTESLTLPVFFNAWQFEKEPHLIVPLLKTAESCLRAFERRRREDTTIEFGGFWRSFGKEAKAKKKFLDWLEERAADLRDTALALGAGLSGEISTPLGKLNISIKEMLAEDRRRQEMRNQFASSLEGRDPLLRYESIYFDLHNHLRHLTGRPRSGEADPPGKGAWSRLNLLFLIDDLDRCLPDKAVEMLEAIKLFLEVEGCAFVIAVDDEVVDRGIAHRYRDYLINRSEADRNGVTTPITGSEYLEKIIHLPVRVPPISESQAREFLSERYNGVFDQHDGGILDLFLKTVPLVPRKLIRTAELFHLLDDVAGKDPFEGYDPKLMARLAILQLFAPEVYRLGRSSYSRPYAARLVEWRDKSVATLEKECQIPEDEEEGKRIITERLYKPLYDALEITMRRRGGFDPRKVFWDVSQDEASQLLSAKNLGRYYEVAEAEAKREEQKPKAEEEPTEVREEPKTPTEPEEKEIPQKEPRPREAREPVKEPEDVVIEKEAKKKKTAPQMDEKPKDPSVVKKAKPKKMTPQQAVQEKGPPKKFQPKEAGGRPKDMSAFLSLATSDSPEQWRYALETEQDQLTGYLLDKESFAAIVERLQSAKRPLSMDWIDIFATHLSDDQVSELYE